MAWLGAIGQLTTPEYCCRLIGLDGGESHMEREVRIVKAGRKWRAAGAGAVLVGVLAAFAASPSAGLPIAGIGLVLFIIGQALE